jgi:hypothetical protein
LFEFLSHPNIFALGGLEFCPTQTFLHWGDWSFVPFSISPSDDNMIKEYLKFLVLVLLLTATTVFVGTENCRLLGGANKNFFAFLN